MNALRPTGMSYHMVTGLRRENPELKELFRGVCDAFGVPEEVARHKARVRVALDVRAMFCYFGFLHYVDNKNSRVTWDQLAKVIREGYNHATAMNAAKRGADWSETEPEFRAKYNEIRKEYFPRTDEFEKWQKPTLSTIVNHQ